jgi:hypothetical protein
MRGDDYFLVQVKDALGKSVGIGTTRFEGTASSGPLELTLTGTLWEGLRGEDLDRDDPDVQGGWHPSLGLPACAVCGRTDTWRAMARTRFLPASTGWSSR